MLSRQYYEPVEFYRRGDSGVRLPLGNGSGLLDRYETSSQMSRRTTPSSETDRHGPAPRKRVPVACERCRKRKIKCSGDDGPGGCSNCRNAGYPGCQFLRVQSMNMDPASTIHTLTQLRASQQQLRSQASHYSSHPYNHYTHSASSHYHPYSRHNSYRQHNHGHQAQSTPSHAENAYSSRPLTPCPSALPSDYTSYNEAASHGVSWTRASSFSAYANYGQDDHYGSQQPASFLLPGGDPMASNSSTYGVNIYSGTRSNSQAHLWGESMQAVPSAGSASYVNNVPDASAYETALTSSGNMARQAMIPYHINTSSLTTNTTSDRVLPNPGGRHYSSALGGSSTLDSLPLSALSHRSSVGWSTDSASSASHISSQTSVTGSRTGQDYSGERSSIHRTTDSSDIAFGLAFNYSPQQGNLYSSTLTNTNENITSNTGYSLSNTGASRSIDVGELSTASAQELPSHHQRCRTVSQSSTPIVNQLSATTSSNPMQQLHRHQSGSNPSSSHSLSTGDPGSSTSLLHSSGQLDAATAPNYPSSTTSSNTYTPSLSTSNGTTNTTFPSTLPPSSSLSSTAYHASATAPSSSLTPSTTSGLYGCTAPPVTQPQRGAGGSASAPSGSGAQSQTRSLGGSPASGHGGCTAVGVGGHGVRAGLGLAHGGRAGLGGLGLGRLGASLGASASAQGQGYARACHSGILGGGAGGAAVVGGAGAGNRGLAGALGPVAGAAEDYAGQIAGDVAAGSSGRTSAASMGY